MIKLITPSKFSISLLVIFFLSASTIFGQQSRPKVGLVLSGGGAKGIAHIGILKAMEEAGLTPDYITGTSMGSIVGGLYAAGYSADELKEIVENADWGELLTNKIPFDKVTFEEKFYYGRYLMEFYLHNKKLQFPKGVIEGQALMELFSNLTRPVHNITDFNDLPIPFACVASDIVTGEPVVLNKGSLAMSMRASMAIPSIFTPVKIGDHLLVDGGLVRNMPVPEVQAMGADIVIGVFVSSDLDPEEDLNSALAILSQSAFLMSAFDSREQLAKCDILVEPDLKDFSTGSFNMASGILAKGEEAGKEYIEIFKHLADSLRQFGPLYEKRKIVVEQKYAFKEIIVEGNKIIPDDFIIGKMNLKRGDSVDMDFIQRRLNIIYGTQYFERMWYEIISENDDQILKVYVVERPKIQFRFSYHYDSENKGGIVGNMTLRNVLLHRSRLIFEADLATHPSLIADYFKYLGKRQNLALRANGYYSKNELPSYDSIGNLNLTFSSRFITGSVGAQTTRKQSSSFGANIQWSSANLKPKIADATIRSISNISYNSSSINLFYQFNNFNDRYFPTKGLVVDVEASNTFHTSGKLTIADTLVLDAELLEGFLQTSGIYSGSLTIFPIIPFGNKVSLLIKGKLRLSNIDHSTLNLDEFDFIGGFIPGLAQANEYYGSGIKEFSAANYFYSRLGVQYKIKNNIYVQPFINYLDTDKAVRWIYPDADIGLLGDRYSRFGYGGTVGISTPIGPISFAVAKDNYRKGWKASLIIGFYY